MTTGVHSISLRISQRVATFLVLAVVVVPTLSGCGNEAAVKKAAEGARTTAEETKTVAEEAKEEAEAAKKSADEAKEEAEGAKNAAEEH
jgi:methyl-accepting chemotaxis protein